MYKSKLRSIAKYMVITGILMLMSVSRSRAQQVQPALKPAVEIQDMHVTGMPRKGNTVEVLVRYKVNVSGAGTVTFRAPHHMHLAGRAAQQKALTINRTLGKGAVRTERFSVIADKSGYGYIHATIGIPDVPAGYKKTATRSLRIHTTANSGSVFDLRHPGNRKPKVIGKDVHIYRGQPPSTKNKSGNVQIQSTQTYNVSISGKIRFYQANEALYRGVYGNGVELWFRNSSSPGNWYNPDTGNHLHESYDILDDQGNFSFDFSYTGDLSAYNQVIVIVNTANDAAFVPTPADGYVEYTNDGSTAYFNEADGVVANFDPSNSNISIDQNGEMDFHHGAIFRYMTLSRNFVRARYNESTPFPTPPIYVEVDSLEDWAGIFCVTQSCTDENGKTYSTNYGPFIMVDPAWTNFETLSHEYGHDINFRMWNSNTSKMNGASHELKEGWAIFYSFAAQNNGNKLYGDDMTTEVDNTEEAPFISSPYRYYGINYANGGEPAKAAFGCFLWNLYDENTTGEFEAATYDTGDNDDLLSYAQRTFETMRTLGTTTPTGYRSAFKSGLASDVQTSVDKDYNFMFDDLYNIPSSKMRPAQVTDFTADPDPNNGVVDFDWQSQDYSSGLSYGNYESGYRLYKDTGSGWQLIQTFSPGTTSYTYFNSNIYAHYKLTSYNTEGNSAEPPIQIVEPLSVSIDGLNVFLSGAQGTWSADASGGVPPYSYTWYRSYSSSSGPYGQVGSGSSYSQTVSQEMWLKLAASDAVSESDEDIMHVYLTNSCSSPPCPQPKIIVKNRIPEYFGIDQNYPNPFNPTTNIKYRLPERSQVQMKVYNVLGRHVATLVDRTQPAGYYTTHFDGHGLASGLYIVRLKAVGQSGDQQVRELKMQLIK